GPVPVVAAVERPDRAVHSELEAHHPAHPEGDLRTSGLVLRSVADEEEVGRKQGGMPGEHVPEMLGARLLLPLEEELEIHRGTDAEGAQGVERREDRDYRGLFVAAGAGGYPALGILTCTFLFCW